MAPDREVVPSRHRCARLPDARHFLRDLAAGLDRLAPARQVVDGQQRIRTLLGFISPDLLPDYGERDEFTVRPAHNREIGGKHFKELDPEIQHRILN